MRAPGLILGRSTMSTSGGTMLETLMRLMLPIPAARSALSKALRGGEPSADPAVAATFVTFFQSIRPSFSPPSVFGHRYGKFSLILAAPPWNASQNLAPRG